jgi:hypothetical protein
MKMTVNWACWGALFLVACSSGDPVDIGSDVTGEKLEDYVATWEGYAEAHDFGDGSDRVRIELATSGEGTLILGDSAPLDLSDPDVWPHAGPGPFPGFAYQIVDARVVDRRIRLEVDAREAEDEWCGIQTPIADEINEGEYRCLPNWVHGTDENGCFVEDPDTETRVGVDCGKMRMCTYGECSCTESACSGAPFESRVSFDAALSASGDELVGTLLVGDRLTVRLTRVD